MSGPYRLPATAPKRFGALIDRSEPVGFRFGHAVRSGFYGDTLASALLASGATTLGASPRLGRPRGMPALGLEDLSMLLVEGEGGAWRPAPADEIGLREGLRAQRPEGAIPLAALRRFAPPADPAARALPVAGRLVERLRRTIPLPAPRLPAAGPVPAVRRETCDALVIGAGLAGLSAAIAMRSAGLDVRIVEASSRAGGVADLYDGEIDGRPLADWAAFVAGGLRDRGALALGEVAIEVDADGTVTVVERAGAQAGRRPTVRLISARAIVLATGFRERPLVFAGNDRPGVYLATTARALIRRHAVAPAPRVIVATTSDEGYRTALDLREAGVKVDFVVDARDEPDGPAIDLAMAVGAPVSLSSVVTGVEFDERRGRIEGVRIRNRWGEGASAAPRVLPADALVVSGGLAPRDELARRTSSPKLRLAMKGPNAVDAVSGGWEAGCAVAADLGAAVEAEGPRVSAKADGLGEEPELVPSSFTAMGAQAAFVDFGADVTLADLARAVERRGAAPEAISRRLGLGLGHDGGRMSADLPSLALRALAGEAAAFEGTAPGRPTLALLAARANLMGR